MCTSQCVGHLVVLHSWKLHMPDHTGNHPYPLPYQLLQHLVSSLGLCGWFLPNSGWVGILSVMLLLIFLPWIWNDAWQCLIGVLDLFMCEYLLFSSAACPTHSLSNFTRIVLPAWLTTCVIVPNAPFERPSVASMLLVSFTHAPSLICRILN